MYARIEVLVKERKLMIGDRHTTRAKENLETKHNEFLKDVKRCMLGGERDSRGPLVLEREYCFECGQRINYVFDGEKLLPDIVDCFHEKKVEVDIEVPSGVLIFSDRLRHEPQMFSHLNKDVDMINHTKGRAQFLKNYAQENFLHFYVGSTSPYIFKNSDELVFADRKTIKGFSSLGSVNTSVWWVSGCDRDIYEQLAIEKFGEGAGSQLAKEAEELCHVSVRVNPGTYRLCYFIEQHKGIDATLTKIR